MKKTHVHLSDLHGYSRLAIDATLGVTDLVEAMHHNILRLPPPFGRTSAAPDQGVHGTVYTVLHRASGLIYNSIRGVAKLVGGGLDVALGRLQPELDQINSSAEREAILSILNGVLGDHMQKHDNPLTTTMAFRQGGKVLPVTRAALSAALPQPSGKILLMLHGHCMNELQWNHHGHHHGEVLAAAHGYTPMYLRYNTGLHVSQNGRALADLLQDLVRAWPVPVQDICVVGYSMGGLLARSALHYGSQAGHDWMQHVSKLLFVGTPHHGSMVERAGNLVDVALESSPYSQALARLGKIRSAGTTDLRYGNLMDEDWIGRDRFARTDDPRQALPLPPRLQCYAIAAMIAQEHSELAATLVGDGLVPLQSALGQHPDAKHDLHIAPSRQKVYHGLTHLGLLGSTAVADQLSTWMAQPAQAPQTELKAS